MLKISMFRCTNAVRVYLLGHTAELGEPLSSRYSFCEGALGSSVFGEKS